jgi:hypothetical protein
MSSLAFTNRIRIGGLAALVAAGLAGCAGSPTAPAPTRSESLEQPGTLRLGNRPAAPFSRRGTTWAAGGPEHRLIVQDSGAFSFSGIHRPDRRHPTLKRVMGAPVNFEPATIERGSAHGTKGLVRPGPSAHQVEIDRGLAVERLSHEPDGVEQTWTFPVKPAGESDLVVRVPATGLELARSSPEGLTFHDPSADLSVKYGAATWVDAAGTRTAIEPRYEGNEIVMRVPAPVIETSSYPAVLDPTIGAALDVDDGSEAAGTGVVGVVAYASLPSPRFGVLFYEFNDPNYKAYLQRIDAVTGANIGTNVDVHVDPDNPSMVSLAFDGSHFVIAWWTIALANEILLQRIDPATGALLELDWARLVSEDPDLLLGAPSIAVGQNGVSLVTWWYHRFSNGHFGIRGVCIHGGGLLGGGAGVPFDIEPESVGGLSGASVALRSGSGGTSHFFVAYERDAGPAIVGRNVTLDVVDGATSTATVGAAVQLSNDLSADANPQVACGSGSCLTTWQDGRAGGVPTNYRIYGNIYDGTSVTGGANGFAIYDPGAGRFGANSVAFAAGSPRFLVPFIEYAAAGTGGQLRSQEVSTAGALLGSPIASPWPAQAGDSQRKVFTGVASNGSRRFLVSYWDDASNEVRARLYDIGDPNGTACLNNLDCSSAFCVSNVCCESACTGIPNGAGNCAAPTPGTCTVSCNSGFLDCGAAPGCETVVSPSHCGTCTTACLSDGTSSPSCSGSDTRCSYVCAAGHKDCLTAGANIDGCETNSTVDGNCGACGVTCTATTCQTAVCDVVAGEGSCTALNSSSCSIPYCSLPINSCTGNDWSDTDGDGLSDAWETSRPAENGGVPFADLNCNGHWDGDAVDISLPGATYNTQDIFVYYNWMNTHDHQPPVAALDQVVAAFRAHSINLHFVDGGPIPETEVTTLDNAPSAACAGTSVSTMQRLRVENFGNRQPAFHYMVFAHRAITPDAGHAGSCPRDPSCSTFPDPNATGAADLPGDDAIVALGSVSEASGEVPPAYLYATTIMHELGHNLGLKHGGPDACTVDKPNYVSIMNPKNYQLNGIPVADAPGSSNYRFCAIESDCLTGSGPCATANACHCTTGLDLIIGFNYCYRLDYANTTMLSLNEAGLGCDTMNNNCTLGGLNETLGVGGPSTDEDMVLYWVPGPSQSIGPSNGSGIDWDNDGLTTGVHIKRDINNDSSFTALSTQTDWGALTLPFQCGAAYGSGGAANFVTNEISLTAAAADHALYPPRKVTIDVRPGCTTNWLAVGSSATVPVALYGEATFDVTTVDLFSIRLAGATASHVAMSDLNGDGRQDLLFDFVMSSLAIDGSTTVVSFNGARTIGQSILGSDHATIVASPGPIVTVHNDGSGYSATLGSALTHQLVTYSLSDCVDTVTDRCGTPISANSGAILRVTSDEVASGSGGADMVINGSSSFSVRKERSGSGDGRVYTVTFTEADAAGNTTQAQCRVQVPHDGGSGAAIDSGVAACVGSGC